jgi:hypothetical protein
MGFSNEQYGGERQELDSRELSCAENFFRCV